MWGRGKGNKLLTVGRTGKGLLGKGYTRKMAMKKMVLAVALVAVAATLVAAQEYCRCNSAEFETCTFPTAEPGVCLQGQCAGATCTSQGQWVCKQEVLPVYTEMEGGECIESSGLQAMPLWTNERFASQVMNVSQADPAEVGNSGAGFLFWLLDSSKQIFFAGSYRIDQTEACGGSQNITVAHLHRLNPGGMTGPPIWYLCGDPMNELPCPTATSGGWAPSPSAQVAIPVSAAADFNDFKNNPSQYYVNIHTTCAPVGLIRGMVEVLPGRYLRLA